MARIRTTRRVFLQATGLAGVGALLVPSSAQATSVSTSDTSKTTRAATDGEYFLEPDSAFFSSAFAQYFSTCSTTSDGDLWPSAWADDDNIYAANGDGTGFSNPEEADVVVNRISGTPPTGITGVSLASGADVANVWADPSLYNRKPTGMVAVDGNGDGHDELYVAVQDLRYSPSADAFNDVPNASISVSLDYGATWTKTTEPMFTDHVFTTVFFLDYGQSQAEARVLGPEAASYVYAYGLDGNWRTSYSDTVPSPTDVYLARVPKTSIVDRSTWEFYAGSDGRGRPLWDTDITARASVLHDARTIYPTLFSDNGPLDLTVISQGGVVYNAPLRRYIYTSWTEYTFEFYEAPQPWGPWKLFMSKDSGCYPWFGPGATCAGPKNGGYAATIPSKFISADGRDMWVQSNWWVDVACGATNYNFSLRPLRLHPRRPTAAANRPDPTNNLARTGQGVATIEKSAHYGHGAYYNDGITTESEDSYDGSYKTLDFWGYTWDQVYLFDEVQYTTGDIFYDGGWFASDLTVQVRRGAAWVDVTGLAATPAYPYDSTAGPNNTYTLSFDPAEGDGLRIFGAPGGEHNFTSIGELAVYFRGRRGLGHAEATVR
jgi:hypothetical protein